MTSAIYWFRNDLRLRDNPAFSQACKNVETILPIYIHQEHLAQETQWSFPRMTKNRQVFLQESLQDLRESLKIKGSDLFNLGGDSLEIFLDLRSQFDINTIYCERIEAPEELAEVNQLMNAGFELKSIWQSSMLDPKTLPFKVNEMPDIFTQFRQKVELTHLKFAHPIEIPLSIPPLPSNSSHIKSLVSECASGIDKPFAGGENKALLHMEQYFLRRLPDTYKQTRNGLIGMDYSSKFSPWLALGCCSARTIAQRLRDYEHQYGANDGTYWLWFELLWRDYFRFLHFKYGDKLYHSKGLSALPGNQFNSLNFKQWSSGKTGEPLVDAGMQELITTGYSSNRMRQIMASYWIYNMQGHWQVGAAWFESQLIDYDVYSNQGNWLYIAGKGTDPRGGRPMNIAKQTQDHDPDGTYRKMWLS
jgi:deoxyribodipyrimidine photo-lyase